MRFFLALFPILAVLALMLWRRWGAHQAGPAGLLVGLVVAALGFGLTREILWVSQAKGLLLSLFVLAVMWPALFLYHWNDQNGGIRALADLLARAMPDRGMCLILLAWGLSGMLEGLAGFGLPIAVVAPMLTALGVSPLRAVAAVAVGHSWAATFGDMGVIFQTLVAVVGLDSAQMVPWAALLLGLACLACGLGSAFILGERSHWAKVVLLAAVMAGTQYGMAAGGLLPLSAFGAGLIGILVYLLTTKVRLASFSPAKPALLTIVTYGSLTLLMTGLTMIAPLRGWTQETMWKCSFPEVKSAQGFCTPAGPGQVFRPLAHPGTLMLVVVCAGIGFSGWRGGPALTRARAAAQATWRSAGAASVGVLSMVGLSTLMDHSGMSYLLAQGLSRLLGAAYPIVSPCVGILGAFATGSNNNSNVLFGSLQKNVALLLKINPALLAAAQTAGGSLGSMLAPVKIILGCSTVGQVGQEGQVMRKTVPYGLGIGLALGLVTWVLGRL
jgi:lactate permease